MSTWFMTQIIAFHDVTVKFYDMGLNSSFQKKNMNLRTAVKK